MAKTRPRLDQFNQLLEQNKLAIQDSDTEQVPKIAENIMEHYSSNTAGQHQMRVALKQFCKDLDDQALFNFTYHLMKTDLKTCNRPQYLRVEEPLPGILYEMCAQRFNYYFVLDDNQATPDPMKLLNQLLANNAEKNNNTTDDDQKPVNGLHALVNDIQFKLKNTLFTIMSGESLTLTVAINKHYIALCTQTDKVREACKTETTELQNMMQKKAEIPTLEKTLAGIPKGKKSPGPTNKDPAVIRAFNTFQRKLSPLVGGAMNIPQPTAIPQTTAIAQPTVKKQKKSYLGYLFGIPTAILGGLLFAASTLATFTGIFALPAIPLLAAGGALLIVGTGFITKNAVDNGKIDRINQLQAATPIVTSSNNKTLPSSPHTGMHKNLRSDPKKMRENQNEKKILLQTAAKTTSETERERYLASLVKELPDTRNNSEPESPYKNKNQ